ncbi:Putative LOC101855726, partial [Caligus rogercresseyi]
NYQTDFNQCSSCSSTMSKTSVGRYCVRFGSDIKQFCSNVCLETSKEGFKVCCYCQKDISGGEGFLAQIGDKGQLNDFCLQSCLKRYEALHLGKPLEKEVLPCAVCSDLKPVEVQLFLKGSSVVKLCGNPCFSAFKFVNSLGTSYCDLCANPYDINASDQVIYYENHVKRFCSMSCQNPPPPILDPATPEFKEGIIREHIVKCPDEVCNKATLTKPPYMSTKGVSCKPLSTSKSTQTDAPPPSCPLPLTVPFYLPVPLRMYASPYPVPVPLPLPIPVPVFMPIKRSSLEGVKKSVQKIHEKLPSDPFEAELLVMAEAIAGKASSLLKDSDTEEEEEYEDIDNLALEISLEINGDNNTDEESI